MSKTPVLSSLKSSELGRPDATYVLTVPDSRGENLIKTTAPPQYFQEPNHIQIFTAEEFESLADSCGLEVICHEYLSGFWSLFFLLKWATAETGENLMANVHPTTILWTQTWEEVLKHPNAEKIRDSLNQALPHSQMIVARRKGANLG